MVRDATFRSAFLRELLASAWRIAGDAAELVRAAARDRPRRDVRRKGEGDFVTAIDLRIERQVRDAVRARHPDHGFLGEESEPVRPDAEFVWVVDPIDGTSNFAQGLPEYAVSIACLSAGRPLVAAVHAEPRAEQFTAIAGTGAWRNGRRLRVEAAALSDATVIGAQWMRAVHEPALLAALSRSGARVRVFGSTVTQLCDVAVGRLHANVQTQGRVWDLAAAALIAKEAGAIVSDWRGRPILPFASLDPALHHPSLVAAPGLHAELVERLPSRPARLR
ncbi:MAG: inositol monophosphatase [Planctomycetes bacterium]|nr:inositol monophosphatase [Planctomycetota bacterium]